MSTLIGSIIVFMLVITLHELGHFTVAKLCNIKVNEFSIGMGPKLVSTIKGETSYSLRLLPIGGYVAMEGEEENSNDPRAFNNVNVFKRMAVVIAGVIMNFILAVIAFLIVFSILGVRTNVVKDVIDHSPAKMAGMLSGDRVVRIENVEIRDWDNLVRNISSKTDEVSIAVNRDGKEISLNVKPELKNGKHVIGITPKIQKNFLSSFTAAFKHTLSVIKDVFKTIKMLFSGEAKVSMLAGPVGVINLIGKETAKGYLNLLNILGIISANLAIINLLPIPALDGGKFLFLLIESITGKKLSEKVENSLSLIGLSFLFGIMIYVTIFGDLNRIING